MALQTELRDLLTQSYCRINELNGLMNTREMEEVLEQNGLKSKLKARNIIANLHQLLDTFYKHLLMSIDKTVLEISDTLKEHSCETDEYVSYMAKLCLIAEKYMKDTPDLSVMNRSEGMEIKEKLTESLVESDAFRMVDYNACASLDLDFELRALFALPLTHIVSHGSGNSGRKRLHTFKLEDVRQFAHDPIQTKEQGHVNCLVKEDTPNNPGANLEHPNLTDAKSQSQTHPAPESGTAINSEDGHWNSGASSINVESTFSKTSTCNLKSLSPNENQDKVEGYRKTISQKNSCSDWQRKFEKKMLDGVRSNHVNKTYLLGSYQDFNESEFKTLSIFSPEKAGEWIHRE